AGGMPIILLLMVNSLAKVGCRGWETGKGEWMGYECGRARRREACPSSCSSWSTRLPRWVAEGGKRGREMSEIPLPFWILPASSHHSPSHLLPLVPSVCLALDSPYCSFVIDTFLYLPVSTHVVLSSSLWSFPSSGSPPASFPASDSPHCSPLL
ncbi:unnamed protein product, partial [Closterium sp. NIES-54]